MPVMPRDMPEESSTGEDTPFKLLSQAPKQAWNEPFLNALLTKWYADL